MGILSILLGCYSFPSEQNHNGCWVRCLWNYFRAELILCQIQVCGDEHPSEEFEVEIKASEVDETTKIANIFFEGDLIEVPAGSDFVIVLRAYGPQNNYRVRGYYGYNGNSYKTFDN